ncbi:hypothetical protein UFOVP1382_154 [uncultured Caudovirales phage]|uniref:Uncharacterized protein n=1 Tax=uncultured Caudovirales phage TaxID=2100421 RepID=A0A6J5S3H2_9CAUD|nr:hypothetical protein UFOVP1382_154 [uncultured Caudovirales phage]
MSDQEWQEAPDLGPPPVWCSVWLVFTGFKLVRVRFTADGEKAEPGSIRVCKALGATWEEARKQAADWIVSDAPMLGRLPHVEGGA